MLWSFGAEGWAVWAAIAICWHVLVFTMKSTRNVFFNNFLRLFETCCHLFLSSVLCIFDCDSTSVKPACTWAFNFDQFDPYLLKRIMKKTKQIEIYSFENRGDRVPISNNFDQSEPLPVQTDCVKNT